MTVQMQGAIFWYTMPWYGTCFLLAFLFYPEMEAVYSSETLIIFYQNIPRRISEYITRQHFKYNSHFSEMDYISVFRWRVYYKGYNILSQTGQQLYSETKYKTTEEKNSRI
jgi:hypothetical protein